MGKHNRQRTADSERIRARHGLLGAGLLLALVLLLVVAAFPTSAQAQCAMCRTAFDSPEGRRMIRHYQAGVLFLLSVPIATFATVAYLAVRNQRSLRDLGDK